MSSSSSSFYRKELDIKTAADPFSRHHLPLLLLQRLRLEFHNNQTQQRLIVSQLPSFNLSLSVPFFQAFCGYTVKLSACLPFVVLLSVCLALLLLWPDKIIFLPPLSRIYGLNSCRHLHSSPLPQEDLHRYLSSSINI